MKFIAVALIAALASQAEAIKMKQMDQNQEDFDWNAALHNAQHKWQNGGAEQAKKWVNKGAHWVEEHTH